jgi:hypothetical protein
VSFRKSLFLDRPLGYLFKPVTQFLRKNRGFQFSVSVSVPKNDQSAEIRAQTDLGRLGKWQFSLVLTPNRHRLGKLTISSSA